MLCHAASTSCTYIAPTAIAINPTDPTRGAEPRRAARAPSVETSQLFSRPRCKSNIVRFDNKSHNIAFAEKGREINIISCVLYMICLYSRSFSFFFFCTNKPLAYSCTLIARHPGGVWTALRRPKSWLNNTIFAVIRYCIWGFKCFLELTVVKIRF